MLNIYHLQYDERKTINRQEIHRILLSSKPDYKIQLKKLVKIRKIHEEIETGAKAEADEKESDETNANVTKSSDIEEKSKDMTDVTDNKEQNTTVC